MIEDEIRLKSRQWGGSWEEITFNVQLHSEIELFDRLER
jgi:hypothetical protein